MKTYDNIIIGAGIYGLYAASKLSEKGNKVLVLEAENQALNRGSWINQARLHSGYHYPRSEETASKSRDYFFRFMNDFKSAIYTDFRQLYAISSKDSKTTNEDFVKFCNKLSIKCDKIDEKEFFKDDMVDGLYDTLEYAIDRDELAKELLNRCKNVDILYNHKVTDISRINGIYVISANGELFSSYWVLNATYAGINNILSKMELPLIKMKYELCEVLLCKVSDNLKNVGITVMDGPFFSVMPFGKTGLHSLTAVEFTPHETSWESVPNLKCQNKCPECKKNYFETCMKCDYKPKSSWDKMYSLAKRYLKDDIEMEFMKSLMTIKPILVANENDDGRPTLVMSYPSHPGFYTVFSGKLNTIYDLDRILV